MKPSAAAVFVEIGRQDNFRRRRVNPQIGERRRRARDNVIAAQQRDLVRRQERFRHELEEKRFQGSDEVRRRRKQASPIRDRQD